MITQSRRGFLCTLTAGGALVVGAPAVTALANGQEATGVVQMSLYVRIEPGGRIVIGSPTAEIGQGTWTSVPMLIAEELDVDFEEVTLEAIDLTLQKVEERFRPATFTLGAGGSTAISESWDRARQAGALVREMLRTAAARQWGVEAAAVETTRGTLLHRASGRSAPYGDFAAAAAELEIDAGELPLKSKADRTVIGTPQRQAQAEAIVRGEPLYGIDQKLPGMLYAVIARAPRFDAEPVQVEDAAALAVPGVLRTLKVKGPGPGGDYSGKPIAHGVAVVAESLWAAMKGRDALGVEWSDGPMKGVSSADLDAKIEELLSSRGQMIREDGDAAAALEQAASRHEARYDLPIVAHAALEPAGMIADVRADGVTLIGSTQSSWACMRAATAITGLEPDQIEVRNVRSGGGFGRRLDTDYAVEALLISKEIGRPVRVHWSREDDLRHDFYRPLVHHRLEAGMDGNGTVTAWRHRLASTARYFRRGVPPERYFIPEYWTDDLPARLVPNMDVEYHFVETAIPFGPWRAPGHTANAFAVESFIDELAGVARADPVEFRLKMLGGSREIPYEQHGGPVYDTGRHAAVINLAAQRSGWRESLGQRRGRGFATHFTFGTYVAHVVDIRLRPDGGFDVERVVSAVDCGTVVNPLGAAAQNEGGINDALSAMRGQAITITDGAVDQSNFDDYPMMRMADAACEIETHFIDSDIAPKGMGEAPTPPLAPAVANAIVAAGGPRLRRLPVGDQLG
ncbi:MAG: xanthine dehydrogenase family protein molybdopterin-binding subunit [Erythrobacter sp.]